MKALFPPELLVTFSYEFRGQLDVFGDELCASIAPRPLEGAGGNERCNNLR